MTFQTIRNPDMPQPDHHAPHPLRRPLLLAEFTGLAVLLASMAWLSRHSAGGLSPAWLLLPAAASLVVFLSFIGLMYLRWVAAAGSSDRRLHRIVFYLLAVTLIGVWIYGIANTWFSIGSQ